MTTPPSYIRAVTTLRNGGIIAELDSMDLATWLRSATGRVLLEGQFDSAISFHSCTFALVLEYLPIHLQIKDKDFLQQVELENLLPTELLSSICWIKPPACHSSEQQKAFALLQVADAYTANNILRDGLCIDNKCIMVHKNKKEPIQCAKCQHYGHITRNCTAQADTCGTCADNHSTIHCNAF
ncbi:hypothetical protein BDR04DRAFT_1008619 [Suillus decipiens]|nr:hypothetical protein BDR04DRAFT_1008619 [Suillus decipiens]